jgi:hypothetical protein
MFWKVLAKSTKVIGATTFVGLLIVDLYLIGHWRESRPRTPDPALGWTEPLPWCLGAFGTPREARFLLSSDWWSVAAFTMISVGVAIDYYKFVIWPNRTFPPSNTRRKP